MQQLSIKSTDLSFRTREAYKTLRSNIEFSGEDVKTVAVTSCVPNEGKSSVSFELARAFAENGDRVLLVDADMRKSVMRNHFTDGKVEYGLSKYLVGKCVVGEAICKTNVENFFVLLSGPSTPSPSELLNSKRFKLMLDEGKQIFDYIIVDTPPLGSVIDSAIVGKSCDGVLVVMASGEISYRFAQDVLAQLRKADCKILGCVLNKADMSNEKGYYSKYYGKYFGK